MFSSKFFTKYLLPGFVFQSITIGGGYGTGRELVEFFMTGGPVSGLLGMVVAMFIWSLVLMATFELARMTQSFDYRSFVKVYLGKGWVTYEIVYLIGMVLVLSVMGSAAGKILSSMTGWPELVGICIMISAVGAFSYFGTSLVEKFLSAWSIGLYLGFIFLISAAFSLQGTQIISALEGGGSESSNWFLSGVEYASYNIGILPAMIFVARHFDSRKEALTSGFLGGFIAMIPGFFIYLALLVNYPKVLGTDVPIDGLLVSLEIEWFTLIFRIILFGTFIETGLGLVHGFNERISTLFEVKNNQMPHWLRLGIAVGLLVLSVFVADAIGIVSLIARGYGTITWGYMLVFLIPVMGYSAYLFITHEFIGKTKNR